MKDHIFVPEDTLLCNDFGGMKFDSIIFDDLDQEADKDKKESAQRNYLDMAHKWNKGGRK